MKKLLLVGLFVFAWWLLSAASGSSQSVAIAIATVVALILPFLLKYVPAAGHYMVAITVGVALLVAVGAELISGELVLSDLQHADTTTLLALFLSVYGLSQFVYALLTQSPKTIDAVN